MSMNKIAKPSYRPQFVYHSDVSQTRSARRGWCIDVLDWPEYADQNKKDSLEPPRPS